MIRIFKMMGLTILGVVILSVIAITLFLYLSPQFGGVATPKQKKLYAKSGHYQEGKFINRINVPMEIDNKWGVFREFFRNVPSRKPNGAIPIEKIDSLNIVNQDSKTTKLTWFGHSTFLMQLDGKTILIDPMLGISPSPHPFIGTKRYSDDLPIQIEKLPFIDIVIISHDHYDHLDYPSIKKLKDKVRKFYTPLGVGNHLIAWGVKPEKIHEMNWWDSTTTHDIELVCTPARHFSGRGLTDRAATLWSSWVIKGKKDNIFFSGDGGYDIHFKEIGEKYGPFDISMIECGQYNEQWSDIHMMPEESVQAAIDLKSKLAMPIHWGAFTLALHNWTDPIERMSKAAKELNLPLATPKIGEEIIVGSSDYPMSNWWKNY